MTQNSGGATINQGSAPRRPESGEEFDITGNVREKGEEPSPGKRERGERTSEDDAGPVDADNS